MSKPPRKEGMFKSKVIPSLLVIAAVGIATALFPGGWGRVIAKLQALPGWFVGDITIPIWSFCLLSLCTLAVVAAIVFLIVAAFASKSNPGIEYTKDEIFGIRWEWQNGQWGQFNLAAFCPICTYQIYAKPHYHTHGAGIIFQCEECRRDIQTFDVGWPELEDRVLRKIQQNLRQKAERKGTAA